MATRPRAAASAAPAAAEGPGQDPATDPATDPADPQVEPEVEPEVTVPTLEDPEHPGDPLTGDVVVILDVVNWIERVEGIDKPVRRRATAGQVLSGLPQATRERMLRHGAVAARGQDAAVALANREAGLAPVVAGELGDTELLGRAPADLVAYVTQHPTEAVRVNRLERQRSEAMKIAARADVLAATGYDDQGHPLDPDLDV